MRGPVPADGEEDGAEDVVEWEGDRGGRRRAPRSDGILSVSQDAESRPYRMSLEWGVEASKIPGDSVDDHPPSTELERVRRTTAKGCENSIDVEREVAGKG